MSDVKMRSDVFLSGVTWSPPTECTTATPAKECGRSCP